MMDHAVILQKSISQYTNTHIYKRTYFNNTDTMREWHLKNEVGNEEKKTLQ